MLKTFKLSNAIFPALVFAGALTLTIQPVFAGECPAGKMQPNARPMVDYKPVGVSDVTLGSANVRPARCSRTPGQW